MREVEAFSEASAPAPIKIRTAVGPEFFRRVHGEGSPFAPGDFSLMTVRLRQSFFEGSAFCAFFRQFLDSARQV